MSPRASVTAVSAKSNAACEMAAILTNRTGENRTVVA